jgi:hypothetical protein
VTTQPGDDTAAGKAGRGHLRASHADREQVVGTLKAAFVAGMVTKDELDARVGQALASRTHADLAALTTDLPAGLAAARPPKPARAKDGQPVLRPVQIVTGATLLYGLVLVYAMFFPHGDNGPVKPQLVIIGSLAYLGVMAIAVAVAAENRQDKRSGGQSPQRPALGAGGEASRRLPSADPGRQLPPGDQDHQQTAEAGPIPARRGSGGVRGAIQGPAASWTSRSTSASGGHPAWPRRVTA